MSKPPKFGFTYPAPDGIFSGDLEGPETFEEAEQLLKRLHVDERPPVRIPGRVGAPIAGYVFYPYAVPYTWRARDAFFTVWGRDIIQASIQAACARCLGRDIGRIDFSETIVLKLKPKPKS